MIDRLFGNHKIKQTASIINELCQMGRHAMSTLGPTGAVNAFKYHPFLISHSAPSRETDPHQFRFKDQMESFDFLVYSERGSIQLFGNGDFHGMTLTTTVNGGYIVNVERSLTGTVGAKARVLANEMIKTYGALDISEYSSRGVM